MDFFLNKVVIVTGGASGIGYALCKALAKEGARVIIADVAEDKAKKVSEELSLINPSVRAIKVDVTKADSVKDLVDNVVAHEGLLDYMFNNAGVAIAGEMGELTLDQWRYIIDINLWGVIYGTHYAYQVFLKQGTGHIINTASVNGLFPRGIFAPYGVSKVGVIRLSEALRIEAMDSNIYVSVVCPGLVETDIINSPVIGSSMRTLIKHFPVKIISAEEAATQILRGVKHKKFMIIFPSYVKFFYWIYRLFPRVLFLWNLKRVRAFRKLKTSRKN